MPTPDITNLICLIASSGAFGGFVFGIYTRNTYKIRLPFTGNLLELGFLGDIFVGIGASITVFFLAGSLFGLSFQDPLNAETYIKILALGVLSGFAGIRLLSNMSSRLLKQISDIDERLEKVEKSDSIAELLRQADFLLNNNADRSIVIYDKALAIDPENETGLIGKAKALRRLQRFDEAISILDAVIQKNPKAERAFYNRACYKNLTRKFSKDEVFADLNIAISLFALCREYAKEDKDFENLWNDSDFLRIITTRN